MINRIALFLLINLTVLCIGCTKPVTIVKDGSSFNSDCGCKHSKDLMEGYYKNAIGKLQKSWLLPNKGWDKDLKSGIVLQVLNDGTIDKAYFEIKSGDEEFDSYVIKAINKANPLPSIPASDCSCLEFILRFYPRKSSN